LVQGSNKTPDIMDIKIDGLLALMRKRIEDTTDEKFESSIKSVIQMLAKKDGSLKHRTQR